MQMDGINGYDAIVCEPDIFWMMSGEQNKPANNGRSERWFDEVSKMIEKLRPSWRFGLNLDENNGQTDTDFALFTGRDNQIMEMTFWPLAKKVKSSREIYMCK